MKYSLYIVVAVVLIAVGAIGFSQSGEVRGISTSRITFGALMPMTGQIAVLGESMRNGMELAREDVMAQYELESFEIIYEDACDGKTSTNAVQKFVAQEVRVVSGSFCLVGLDAVLPLLVKHHMIAMNTAANPEGALNNAQVFSTNFTIRNDARALVDYAANQLKARRLAVIHFDTSFGESYRNNLNLALHEYSGEVVFASAAGIGQTDFRTELTKMKAANPDVLIIIHFGSSLGSAIKQARELGITVPIMGDYESEDQTVIEYAGRAAEGFVISSSRPSDETVQVSSFAERYEAKYGKAPDVLATNAYDAVRLQAAAYVVCAGDTDCMASELEKVTNYDGVSGRISINPEDHSVEKPNVFKVVRDGKFVTVE